MKVLAVEWREQVCLVSGREMFSEGIGCGVERAEAGVVEHHHPVMGFSRLQYYLFFCFYCAELVSRCIYESTKEVIE